MLIYFSMKNYKSFKDEVVFDMRATQIRELKDSIIKVNNNKLLSVATIYGANASGKSNFLSGIYAMASNIFEREIAERFLKRENKNIYFQYSKDKIESTEFEINFISNSKEYIYRYKILNNSILEEEAYRCYKNENRLLFKRDSLNETIELAEEFKSFRATLEGLKLEVAFLEFINNYFENEDVKNISDWFMKVILYNQMLSFKQEHSENIKSIIETGIAGFEFEKSRNKIVDYINSFEPTVVDIEIEKDKDAQIKEIKIIREIDGKKYKTDLFYESDGTKKMLVIYFAVKSAITNNVPIIIDELDSNLHPLLLRLLILFFHNRELGHNAQLIATLHDISILNKNTLRRDEVWFVKKNNDLSSEMYSLYDIKTDNGDRVRNDSTYDKNYLNGYYGAIPELNEVRF